jgi:type IV secretory pathway VirB4 component
MPTSNEVASHILRFLKIHDNQVIIANSEDNLQRGVFTLQNIVKDFGMEILPEKSETMAFLGQGPVRCG